jgi:hypothetical protein
MKFIAFITLALTASQAFATLSKCEQKIQRLMLSAEEINYPDTAQRELSKFEFQSQGDQISATGVVYVYNGDTIYRIKGHRLPFASPDDCVIKELSVEVLP